ncbi:MAG: beta-lactamase family protein [Gammaproteobacteria bacterium]|nr:beta-lactamase family protein [Gammaproteobacteria bacterium]MBI5615521.1 beta-lactamase family protein [Gammaproteobacteria bacterium]
MTPAIDALFRSAIEAGEVPGAVAAVATDRGLLYEGAFGQCDREAGTPMRLDTQFRIASMTKAVTSVAAMQLVEQGRLGLDMPVEAIMPEFGELEVLVGFYGDTPALRKPARPATIRELMTHTAGLAYEFWNAPMLKYLTVTGTPSMLAARNASLTTPLCFDPGSCWNYGIHTDWLGRAVETVSGQTLDAYLQEWILEPLGMRQTTFAPDDAQRARLTPIYGRTPDGGLARVEFDWPTERDFWNGGHGLHCEAGDYVRFLRMFLNGGSLDGVRVLERETVTEMCRNHIGDLWVTCLPATLPAYSLDAEFFPGEPKKHGLGFMINCNAIPGMRAAGSQAWAGIFNSYYWFDPASKLCAVLMLQTLPFADGPSITLFERFERAVYASFGRAT